MSKAPSLADLHVKVTAYMTDEVFGYDHWRAAQFSAPVVPSNRPALLLIFDTEEERDAAMVAPNTLRDLASAMKKMLPPLLLAEVIAHLDPLAAFVDVLRNDGP
jgi:hypothetical protein